jgi:hypothetical protein
MPRARHSSVSSWLYSRHSLDSADDHSSIMAPKRGRPLSTPSDNPAVQRRREQAAGRNGAYHEGQRQLRADLVQATASQEQQRDEVLERPFSSSDVAETPLQLGLRVQGMGLAPNSADAEMQKQGVPVDDHHSLYDGDNDGDNHSAEPERSPWEFTVDKIDGH